MPYAQVRPQPSRPSQPPASPKRRTLATVVWSLLLVVALLSAGSRGGSSAVTTSAVAMVGTDGLTVWFSDGEVPASASWARTRGGVPLSTSGPDSLGWWLVVTQLDRTTTDLARFSWVTGSTPTAQGDELFSLVNGEVRREVVSDNGAAKVYRGGRLELPADAHAGSTWTSAGFVRAQQKGTLGEGVAYTSRGTAARPPEEDLASAGCLDVAIEEDAQGLVDTTTRTWCPSRGIVRFVRGSQSFAETRMPTSTVPTTSDAFPWARTEGLLTSTMKLTPLGVQLIPAFISRPGVLPGGRLVGALRQANDVVAIDPASRHDNLDRTVWRAHPGGIIQTCVTIGELTVVTTSERRAVAYGPSGIAAWTAALPDTASRAALVFGGNIVIATVDGSLQALSATSGHPVWRTSMPSELQLRPAVSADTLVAIDENGTMVALGTDGHELWRNADQPVETFAISGGVVMTSERGASALRGYDLATGSKLWRAWEPALVRSFADLDGVMVADASGGVRGFDPATGALLWVNPSTQLDSAVIAGRVVLATTDSVVVLDRAGHEAARWPHGLSRLPQLSIWVAAGPDSLVAVTSSELFQAVIP